MLTAAFISSFTPRPTLHHALSPHTSHQAARQRHAQPQPQPRHRSIPPTMCAPPSSAPTDENLKILTYQTTPIEGQSTGTSGMRKKTKVLLSQPTFLPNWIQSLFNALGGRDALSGATLVLGGDGRFYNRVASQTILRMAAANGVSRVIVGRDVLLTTPAASALIPARQAIGGIILTASHNSAGPDADWGVKYNVASGAPAQPALTDAIYEQTLSISEYYLADFGGDVDLSSVGETTFGDKFVVEVVDPVAHYRTMLHSIFDFDTIRTFLARSDFSMLFDAMHASTGEYARVILEDDLGAPSGTVVNGHALEDFGGGHPDPNLTYAAELVALLDPEQNSAAPHFGAASDGDGDRNMILGRGIFVSPGDSVAIIADYAVNAIPYFRRRGLAGFARSMPTSSALDRVAENRGVQVYETPTGWKFFTNLMDAGKINVCGEESFGTGSDHIREKDGLWAVLCWLSILAHKNRDTAIGELVTVESILLEHWRTYGRTYNMRYDYEEVDSNDADNMMINMRGMVAGVVPKPEAVDSVVEFDYTDPVDGSIAEGQGFIVQLLGGARVVFRLSGTGSAGATVRMYFELYEPPRPDMEVRDPRDVFADAADIVLDAMRVEEFTGRKEPSVIT